MTLTMVPEIHVVLVEKKSCVYTKSQTETHGRGFELLCPNAYLLDSSAHDVLY